jgi:hypothetical protein
VTGTIASITDTAVMTTTGNLLTLTANAATTTTGLLTLNANALTSGSAINVLSSSAAQTGALQTITLSGSNAANTGSLLSLQNTGTANASTTLLIQHDATGTNNLAFRINDVASDTTPFVVDGAGNVGIGTAAPVAKFTLSNNLATGFLDTYAEYQQIIHDGGTAATSYGFGMKTSNMVFNSGAGGYSFDRGGAATAMTIDTTGNVGIGDSSPTGLFTVGSGDLFTINSSGIISSSNNITPNSVFTTGQTDEYCLTYEATGTTWEWQTCGGGMAIGGTITSATAGSVLFAGTSGVLEQDNASFFFDNSTNRLGLGTTSPAAQLSIFGTSNAVRLSYDVSNYGSLAAASNGDLNFTSSNTSESQFIIGNGGSVDASVAFDGASQDYYAGVDQTTGSFMIGSGFVVGTSTFVTVASTGNLTVTSDIASNYAGYFFNDGNNANRYGIKIQAGADDASGTTYYLDAYDGDGGQVGYIANTSGTFAVTDVSDRRTKTNITDTEISSALSIVESLRVVDFNRLADPDGPRITGFIAQEVNDVYPYAVTTGKTGYYGIQKDAFIPLLVKAVQEQQGQIEDQGGTLIDIDLAVSGAITTVTDLQTAVASDLQTISGDVALIDDNVTTISNDVALITDRTEALETQMQILIEQVTVLSEFYTTFDLGNLVAKDLSGNVDLLDGKLRAKILETGALTIETVDAAAPTLGKATIVSGQTGVVINTTAVNPNSRIFVTAKSTSALNFPLTVLSIQDGTSFMVGIPAGYGSDIEFDWWIVTNN